MVHDRDLILYQIFFIFILPVALLILGIIPISWRMVVLCVAILFMYGVIKKENISDSEMGLSRDTFKKSLIPYLIFTTLGALVFVRLSSALSIKPNIEWWKSSHFLFLFLPVSLLQEIAYRGFLFQKLKKLYDKWWIIIALNTILFTIIHAIYPMPGIMLPVAFFSGLGIAIMYRYYPNLLLVSFTHIILNFIAVLHGFFFLQG